MSDVIDNLQNALTNPYLMVGLVLVILLFSFKTDFVSLAAGRFVGPASFVNSFPEPEPNVAEACHAAGGICIPPWQKVPVGMADYGACDSVNKCVVNDLCEATGGRYIYPYNVFANQFSKRCECPLPLEYKLATGCTQPYGETLRSTASGVTGCPYFEASYVPELGKCLANLDPVPCEDNGGLYNFDRYWCEWNPL